MGGKKPLRRPLWPPTRATASNYYPLGLDGAGGATKPLLRAPKKPAPLHGRLPAFSGAVDAFERARKCFLEWRYFFSIILSEFLKNRVALQQPYPVEYKRGKPKEGTEDTLQLCGQAMCLEEMLCCEIPRGALYYGEPRRRTEVDFTPELRQEVRALLEEMHALYARGNTPKVKPTKGCNACSLKGLCLPKLMRSKSVSAYLRGAMEGEQ